MKAMTKIELARAAGVSSRTLARWLRMPPLQQMLLQYHVTPQQQLLPPVVVRKICEHLCIDVEP